ncbi:MAG: tetratricopeptide repeat protein [Rhodospirillaceae bacterium]|jgi:tetratricopeptide (TPR) repeat protein|nr:tetratricopeptide repeat protein [Rhodospirillaceae bacterium]MBT4938788.1 tetratricopeptide repeat protein [Rhodospirillaceae bacterium]MBT7268210.1 tetratricopeptide repeat protein [Rhodospirillaceae bacterium]
MKLGGDLRIMKRGGIKVGFVLVALFALSGCDLIKNSNLMDSFKRDPKPAESIDMSERGFGKLAKGEFLAAQALFDQALQTNPRDVYALFGKGIVLQHSGQLVQARQVYEAILALRPGNDKQLLVINDLAPQSVRELAGLNLSLLQSQGVSNAFGPPGNPGSAAPAAPSMSARIPAAAARAPALPRRIAAPAKPMTPGTSVADTNVISRFETLRKLRDQGLVTPAEYAARRKRNIGALTKLTSPPPAAGLQRSVPSATQISQRLKAIGRALELRAITIRQHGAERTMIIDGLMPSNPKISAAPALAPKGLMPAAAAVRRIEMLKERGLISDAEYGKEKAAIEKILAPKTPVVSKAAKAAASAKKAPSGGPKPAVHLASFRSKQAATRAWTQLRRAHRSLLGKLKSEVTRVNLGRRKGVYYRLIAGPFKSTAAATQACRRLKSRRQYCDTAFMSGG